MVIWSYMVDLMVDMAVIILFCDCDVVTHDYVTLILGGYFSTTDGDGK